MTEREIREVIRELCDELDECARRVVKKVVLPSMLGAGLALAGGCSDNPVPAYGMPDGHNVVDKKVGGTESAYGMPDQYKKLDLGAQPPYSVPMDKAIQKVDGGSAVLYSVPQPDRAK
jgi:hypothetical protein